MAIDFRRMADDAKAAREACELWAAADENKGHSQKVYDAFEEGFRAGIRKERANHPKWKLAKYEKPEPDAYIIAAEDCGDGNYDFVIGSYVADHEPYVSNAHQARMWHCIDKWIYVDDFSKGI